MIKSKRVQIRLNASYQERLRTAKTILGISEDSAAVRHLLDIGLTFYKDRQRRVNLVLKEIEVLDIKPKELGIKEKRKYLGR